MSSAIILRLKWFRYQSTVHSEGKDQCGDSAAGILFQCVLSLLSIDFYLNLCNPVLFQLRASFGSHVNHTDTEVKKKSSQTVQNSSFKLKITIIRSGDLRAFKTLSPGRELD